jgi:hypothetical protein
VKQNIAQGLGMPLGRMNFHIGTGYPRDMGTSLLTNWSLSASRRRLCPPLERRFA